MFGDATGHRALLGSAVIGGCGLLLAVPALAAAPCPTDHGKLTAALKQSVKASGGPTNGGLDNNEWAAVVNRDGAVCAVTFSGAKAGDQWPASRGIAAEKANTANGVSVKTFALSTANLYSGAQPGGYLYGLTTTDPAAATVISAGDPGKFGSADDPMQNKAAGGVVVFGGGLALYDGNDIVGALGVSGDTSCADHNVAWRVRQKLGLDKEPAGPGPQKDGIIYDIGPNGKSASGYGHPACGHTEKEIANQIGAGSGAGGP